MEKVEITETTTIQQPKKQWVKPAMEVMEVDNASSGDRKSTRLNSSHVD